MRQASIVDPNVAAKQGCLPAAFPSAEDIVYFPTAANLSNTKGKPSARPRQTAEAGGPHSTATAAHSPRARPRPPPLDGKLGSKLHPAVRKRLPWLSELQIQTNPSPHPQRPTVDQSRTQLHRLRRKARPQVAGASAAPARAVRSSCATPRRAHRRRRRRRRQG